MISCVCVTNSWRIPSSLASDSQTICCMVASHSTTCGATAASVGSSWIIATKNQSVEVQTDLADGRINFGNFIGTCSGCGVGGGEIRILDVGNIFRYCCSTFIGLVDAAN